MKLENVKDKIDNYFEMIATEEFKETLKRITSGDLILDEPKEAKYVSELWSMVNKDVKFSFDFHGVLDSETKPYKYLAKSLLSQGFDVYLITGTMKGDYLTKELNSEGIYEGVHFNKFFSVSDYLIEQGFPCEFIREGNPYFGEIEEWDSAKGLFCAKEGIDLHFDDSVEYEKYFTTGFELVV